MFTFKSSQNTPKSLELKMWNYPTYIENNEQKIDWGSTNM